MIESRQRYYQLTYRFLGGPRKRVIVGTGDGIPLRFFSLKDMADFFEKKTDPWFKTAQSKGSLLWRREVCYSQGRRGW
jgi:hypothetical protein